MEARVEEQLAEFDTEREQLRSRLKKEEAHCCQLQQQVGRLQPFQSVIPLTRSSQHICSLILNSWRS